MNRRTFLLLGLTPLCGCASGVWNLPSYDDLPPEKSGVAIASVGGQWSGNARFSVGFRPVASPNTVGEFVFLRQSALMPIPIDIENDGLYATVAARRLAPGMYEIYGAMVMIYIGAQVYYRDKRPFSFPFEIVPGKATYLGEFLGFPARGIDNLGVERTMGAFFTVRDRLSRDLVLLRKRGVEYSREVVISSVMTKAQSSNSIFRRLDDAP
jgi:hypothetical protein